MLKNRRLAKSISDVSLGEFVRQITYKAEWFGKTIVFVNRWYPSSKTCYHCGYINQALTLNDREWLCPRCGKKLNRDFNASQNIKKEGLKIVGITRLACGANVKPVLIGNLCRNKKPLNKG
jgi:putative transposase